MFMRVLLFEANYKGDGHHNGEYFSPPTGTVK